jgi:hypothetical protein
VSQLQQRLVPGVLSLLGGITAGYVGTQVGLQGWPLVVVPVAGVLAGLLGVLVGGPCRAVAVMVILVAGVFVVRAEFGSRAVACWGLALLTGVALAFCVRSDVAVDPEVGHSDT